MPSRPPHRDRPSDPFAHRRRRYKATLDPLGLWKPLADLPPKFQKIFLQAKFPDPIVELDHPLPSDFNPAPLLAQLDNALRTATVDVNHNGHTARLAARDVFTILAGCALVIRGSNPKGLPPPIVQFIREIGPTYAKVLSEQTLPAIKSLADSIFPIIAAASRLDSRVITLHFADVTTSSGKYGLRFIVSASEPQRRSITLDGGSRLAYPIPTVPSPTTPSFIRWPRELLSRSTGPTHLPVYIQSHALHRVRDRLNLPSTAPYLEAWLAHSLEEPNIVESAGPTDLLVEFRLLGHRVGYLVATPLPNAVVIRTFKFLTMQGTPEANLLYRHLRLTRPDIDYLSLDSLKTFIQSDLAQDPVLRPLLKTCNCDQLFALATPSDTPLLPTPIAANIRRYLRLAA